MESWHTRTALFTVSLLSLVVNAAVLIYQAYVVITKRRNPLKAELYPELNDYQKVAALREAKEPAPSTQYVATGA